MPPRRPTSRKSIRERIARPSTTGQRIVIDTREQKPLLFPIETVTKTLKTGDYSIEGHENEITIERKTPAELYLTCGAGRARFEKELERMRPFVFRAIVIEGTPTDVSSAGKRSRVTFQTIMLTLLSWQLKYDVHVIFAGNRKMATKITAQLLLRYAKYRRQGVEVIIGVKGWK